VHGNAYGAKNKNHLHQAANRRLEPHGLLTGLQVAFQRVDDKKIRVNGQQVIGFLWDYEGFHVKEHRSEQSFSLRLQTSD
jgi:hypothetical protein